MSMEIEGVVELRHSSGVYEGIATFRLGSSKGYVDGLWNKVTNTDPLRGFPQDASNETIIQRSFWVVDTDHNNPNELYLPIFEAKKAVLDRIARWYSEIHDRIYYVNTSSWVTAAELKTIIPYLDEKGGGYYLSAMLALMKSLSTDLSQTRFVYWFA